MRIGVFLACAYSEISNLLAQLSILINPSYTGGLFHCYMLDNSICHFRGVRSILSFSFILFLIENPASKQCRP